MRILIAEDSELNFEVLAECLGVSGQEMSWARDGEQAIEILEASEFDLLLLDLHMPHVDGISVLKWLRETRESSEMKVIVLTADDGGRDESVALGADAFLTKPLDLKQLSAAIKVVTGIAAGCNGPEEPT
jgi:DNA-binding response OmpR family regulator